MVVVALAGLCAAAGAGVAVMPFRSSVDTDLSPAGPACRFEEDPGSGASWLGVERVVDGLAPYRVCDPIGPLSLATSGPEFEAAVSDPQLPALAGRELDRVLAANRTGPPWPATAVPQVATVAAIGFGLMIVVVWGIASLLRWASRSDPAQSIWNTERV